MDALDILAETLRACLADIAPDRALIGCSTTTGRDRETRRMVRRHLKQASRKPKAGR